jgi:predicted component of viral defense system (DUF524 family)
MQRLKNVNIPILLPNGGNTIVELTLKSKFSTLEIISAEEARENGEAQVQIKEGQTYEFRVQEGYQLRCNDKIVRASKLNSFTGTIEPGNYVGTLTIHLISIVNNNICSSFKLEVQSVKADYRTHYRWMLQEIAERCTELIMQHSVPITQNFIPDHSRQHKTIYQRFTFIKSMINSEEFDHAIHKILQSPVVVWKQEECYKDVAKLKRLNHKQLRQLATALNGSNAKLLSFEKTPTVDANENRFIKHALHQFLEICSLFLSKLEKSDQYFQEVIRIQEKLSHYLNHDLFKDIGLLQSVPLNSPVLQKKEGYREILRVWIMFEVASQLSWSGGEDAYDGGKKDVAVLYEYWLFFKLYDTVIKVFKLVPKNIDCLFESTPDGLGLKLKRGQYLALNDTCTAFSRNLHVQFSYNRIFTEHNIHPDPGSWTTQLRPDFTLSIWPMGLSNEEAEREELITHIHFDSKYKAEYSVEKDDQQNAISSELGKKVTWKLKNEDLLKMHAYKDAIRRTAGAYVLYPGTHSYIHRKFHEILPGVGAFAISPSVDNSGIAFFEKFLSEVVCLHQNRASQREKLALRIFQIHKSQASTILDIPLPEILKNNRNFLLEETQVIVGYYKSNEHLDWIKSRKLFNTRISDKSAPIYIDQSIIGAQYLLLHNRSEPFSMHFFKLQPRGGRICTKKELIQFGYPSAPTQNLYLVFEIADDLEPEFLQYKWDVTKLKKYVKGKGYALPFGSDLHELMQCLIF